MALVSILVISGCGPSSDVVPSEDCFVASLGKRQFLGSPECVAQFETETMSGYWLVDFETSLFFTTQEDVERGLIKDAYSLDFLHAPSGEISSLLNLPREKIFRVSFEGSKSETPGIYGALAELRGGVVVKRKFLIEEEIRDVSVTNLSM